MKHIRHKSLWELLVRPGPPPEKSKELEEARSILARNQESAQAIEALFSFLAFGLAKNAALIPAVRDADMAKYELLCWLLENLFSSPPEEKEITY